MIGPDHRESSGCPIACSLDIIGDRWTLLIIRDLMFMGKHEYNEFLAMPEGISTNILADRLKRLQKEGIIDSARHPMQGNKKLYYLTAAGKDLIDIMMAIVIWGAAHLKHIVDIPTEKRAMLKEPERMKKYVLTSHLEWEAAHLELR